MRIQRFGVLNPKQCMQWKVQEEPDNLAFREQVEGVRGYTNVVREEYYKKLCTILFLMSLHDIWLILCIYL